MRTLYIDTYMGAAGDMLTAALLELLPDKDAFVEELNGLGIPNVCYISEAAVKCGITGTHMTVKINGVEEGEHEHEHNHEHGHHHEHERQCALEHDHDHHHDHHHNHEHHHHSSMADIEAIVNGLNVSDKVKKDVMAVYGLIAEAESHAHGRPVTEIHFHEVGSMDAVADVTAVCMLMERLNPEQVVVSPVHVGSGHVHCAHGVLPVPAPATAYILKDVPMYGGNIKGELCTPTGAALLKHFATSFGEMPVMKVSAIGYGMGKKDFPMANCVRTMLGETLGSAEKIIELSCNIDDMTGEAIGFAMERCFEAGARDVFYTSIGMKKSRPGIMFTVICAEEDKEKLISEIFKHTSTLGIRENVMNRYTLERDYIKNETPYGTVTEKVAKGFGVSRSKYEYADLARIALEQNCSIEDVKKTIKKC